jgi:hypothetical protein
LLFEWDDDSNGEIRVVCKSVYCRFIGPATHHMTLQKFVEQGGLVR